MGEYSQNHECDEPSVMHTRIELNTDLGHLARLRSKLGEYKRRISSDTYKHPEQIAVTSGLDNHFRAAILALVLDEQRSGRDFSAEPLELPEVALVVQDLFRVDLSASITTPFVRGGLQGAYGPDRDTLLRHGTPRDLEFTEAYAVVMAYASGRLDELRGGTGLPEV